MYKTNLEVLLKEGGKKMLENEIAFEYVTELDEFLKGWESGVFTYANQVLSKVYKDRRRGIFSSPNREYVEAYKAKMNIYGGMMYKLEDLIRYNHVKDDPLKPFAWLVVCAAYESLSKVSPEVVEILYYLNEDWDYELLLKELIGKEVLSIFSRLRGVYSPREHYILCKLAEDLRDMADEIIDDEGKKQRNEFLEIIGEMYLKLLEKEGTIKREGSSIYKPMLPLEEFVEKNIDLIRKVTPYNVFRDMKTIIEDFQTRKKLLGELWEILSKELY